MWEPLINCGYLAGMNPEYWNRTYFESEEDCQEWIDNNLDNFTFNELEGGIFPHKID